uniref:Uncharacterized protein n=1 Tax=Sphaerodactylus townsendi TaxID=933632 RepID=A0ACB8F9E2_9SAUR
MKLRAELPIPPHTVVGISPQQMRKWKQFPVVARVPDELEGNLSSQMPMGNPQNGTQKMQLEVTTPTLQAEQRSSKVELRTGKHHAEMIPVSQKEVKTTANVRLNQLKRWQEVPEIPETDPASNKNLDIVVQDLCEQCSVWQKHQNELKAAAAARPSTELQQPTMRTVVKAQHCSRK